jgi:Family of unknown function (DUF5681)
MHKKYATIDTLFAEEGQRRMTVTVGGRKRSITMAEAVIKIAYQQALKGDKTMLKEVLQKLANLPAPPDENTWIYRISPKQEEIFDAVLKDAEEFRRETNEGSEDN